MQAVEMTAEEMEVLRDVVVHALGDINVEVFRTDTRDFRDMLRHRREVLERLLARLETVSAHTV